MDRLTGFPVPASALVVRHVYESDLVGFADCDAEFYGDIYGVAFYYCCSGVRSHKKKRLSSDVLIRHLFGIVGG